jgi:hypothetical protein
MPVRHPKTQRLSSAAFLYPDAVWVKMGVQWGGSTFDKSLGSKVTNLNNIPWNQNIDFRLQEFFRRDQSYEKGQQKGAADFQNSDC